jgi:hypothetical protein
MFNTARLITASLLGIAALASALPASAQQNARQNVSLDSQKRAQATAVCRKEADTAVPTAGAITEKITMDHYLVFARCLEKFGYEVGDNARGRQ